MLHGWVWKVGRVTRPGEGGWWSYYHLAASERQTKTWELLRYILVLVRTYVLVFVYCVRTYVCLQCCCGICCWHWIPDLERVENVMQAFMWLYKLCITTFHISGGVGLRVCVCVWRYQYHLLESVVSKTSKQLNCEKRNDILLDIGYFLPVTKCPMHANVCVGSKSPTRSSRPIFRTDGLWKWPGSPGRKWA